MTGSITFSWKLPDWPAIVIVASLPMTCAATIAAASGNHRIHLARHDAAARLQRRQRDLAEPGERPAVHPAQVVRDLHQADGDRLQLAGQLHRRVLRGHATRSSSRLGANATPVSVAQLLREARAELRMRVDAGADRRAALRQRAAAAAARSRSRAMPFSTCVRQPDSSCPSVTGMASIRCVRPVFTMSPTSRSFARSTSRSCSSAGMQIVAARRARRSRGWRSGMTSLLLWPMLT